MSTDAVQRRGLVDILHINSHVVYDQILSRLSPATLVRFRGVNRKASDAVKDYSERAFDINRRLPRFFSDPVAFRSLQARTATLISGSFALQLFDRSFYPDSDLDLYPYSQPCAVEVGEFLMRDGYTFTPTSWQKATFREAARNTIRIHPPSLQQTTLTPLDQERLQQYGLPNIGEVYTFTKSFEDSEHRELKVQVILPHCKSFPFACILGYHSTCVMNVISYSAAYSLYPYATFEQRYSLALIDECDERRARMRGIALRKYAVRGWKVISASSPHAASYPSPSTHVGRFFKGVPRFVNDGHSWVVRFNMDGVVRPEAPSPSSTALSWDPVAECGWRLSERGSVWYDQTVARVLKYRYTVGDERLEYMKVPEHPVGDERGEWWTWWDSELPFLRERFAQIRETWRSQRNRDDEWDIDI